MIIDPKKILVASTILAITGCTANDPGLGDSVRSNYAAQIVEPDPQYAESMNADGSQIAGAQDRYRNDKVKKPVGVKTTTGASGGGRSGSSSGGN